MKPIKCLNLLQIATITVTIFHAGNAGGSQIVLFVELMQSGLTPSGLYGLCTDTAFMLTAGQAHKSCCWTLGISYTKQLR